MDDIFPYYVSWEIVEKELLYSHSSNTVTMKIEIDTNRTNQVTLCRDRRGYKMNKIIITKIGNKNYIVIILNKIL